MAVSVELDSRELCCHDGGVSNAILRRMPTTKE